MLDMHQIVADENRKIAKRKERDAFIRRIDALTAKGLTASAREAAIVQYDQFGNDLSAGLAERLEQLRAKAFAAGVQSVKDAHYQERGYESAGPRWYSDQSSKAALSKQASEIAWYRERGYSNAEIGKLIAMPEGVHAE